jgi:hypothetical protein
VSSLLLHSKYGPAIHIEAYQLLGHQNDAGSVRAQARHWFFITIVLLISFLSFKQNQLATGGYVSILLQEFCHFVLADFQQLRREDSIVHFCHIKQGMSVRHRLRPYLHSWANGSRERWRPLLADTVCSCKAATGVLGGSRHTFEYVNSTTKQ